jgi:hypothetical protein
MKIAVGLYGQYSDWYRFNDYEGVDIFGYAIGNAPTPFKSTVTIDTDEINLRNVRTTLMETCKNLVSELIPKNTYDIVVFTTFKTLLTLPTVPGIYHTKYRSFDIRYISNPIPGIEIVSDTHIRIDGGLIEIWNDSDHRKLVLQKIFKDRAIDFEDLKNIELKESAAIFIPSVINISCNPFDYVTYRSIYPPDTRLEQTALQIKRVSKPTFLLEGSVLNLGQIRKLVEQNDQVTVVLFSKDSVAYGYANTHSNKSIYELYVMRQMLEKVTAPWYYKFGARYHMTDAFRYSNFEKDKPVYRIVTGDNTFTGDPIVVCIIYAFPHTYRETYKSIYSKMIELADTTGLGIEGMLYEFTDEYYVVSNLDVFGNDAIEGFENLC